MSADGTRIINDFNRLKQRRYNFDARWEAMAPFIAPSREGIITERPPGYTQTRGVYDSSTMMAAETMAMFIAGHIINPSQQWVGFKMRDPLVAENDEVTEWLEECRDITLKRLAASPFYAEGPESLIDYGGFGTGFLLCEEAPQPSNRIIRGFRGFYFKAEKTGRFIIDEGPDGLVDTAYREFKLTCRVINDLWGDEPGAISEKVQNHIKTGRGDEQLKIIHAICPRPRAEQGAGDRGMPWCSAWVEYDSKHVIHEGGYRTFPAAVPRYHKTPSEIYGRGRGDLAFPDTWTLNTAKRMGLEDWALKIRPPLIVRSDSVIGTLRLTPGGPTTLNTHGMRVQDVIMPFDSGGKPEVSQIKEEELRKSIREIFYVDAIRQLLQVEKSEMTAFEFAKKIELLFRLLGPVYGRLEWEYLYRLVDIAFNMQMEAKAFPPPPPEAYQSSDGEIDIEFQNPIAKAQRAGDAEALQMAINDLAPLAQMNPDILDRLDPDEVAKGIFDIRGVPAKWLRDDKEFKALKDAKAQQNQQENALAMAEQAGGAMGKMAPALKMLPGGKAGAGLPAGINMAPAGGPPPR